LDLQRRAQGKKHFRRLPLPVKKTIQPFRQVHHGPIAPNVYAANSVPTDIYWKYVIASLLLTFTVRFNDSKSRDGLPRVMY
jgi:hypothetical protein